jgi:hypothetical protein
LPRPGLIKEVHGIHERMEEKEMPELLLVVRFMKSMMYFYSA